MQITQRKIKSLEPEWSLFRGASVIFDPIGPTQHPSDINAIYSKLAAIANLLAEHGWREKFGFCALPEASYHVTLADLINDGNFKTLPESRRAEFGGDRIQSGKEAPRSLVHMVEQSGLLEAAKNPIVFTVKRLEILNDTVLVATLVPRSDDMWRRLLAARRRLSASLSEEFNVRLQDYVPHVSLGYYANRPMAKQAAEALRAVQLPGRLELMKDAFLVSSAKIYSFADMSMFKEASTNKTV